MEQINMEMGEVDVRLSHSSASLLLSCEQRYWHYKVNGTAKDPDFDDNQKHFAIGKAFHWILETTMHKNPKEVGMSISKLLIQCTEDRDIGLEQEDMPRVHALVLAYLRKFKETNFEVVAVEFDIESSTVIGFIDALVRDTKTNKWYILDLKTSKYINKNMAKLLRRNRQLNLYAYFKDQFADRFELDKKDFGGVIYWTTTKSQANQRESEDNVEFVKRLLDATKSEYFIIDKDDLVPGLTYENHSALFERSLELRKDKKPMKNFDSCFNYFTPCPYLSKCYGKCFSEIKI